MPPPAQVEAFGLFSADDPTDDRFTCSICWSRIYEYPFALRQIDAVARSRKTIHNASWGYEGIHVVFKTYLDARYPEVVHSDRIPSELYGCVEWNLLDPPPHEWLGRFDAVLCISTLEEVNRADHAAIIEAHLLPQVREGGRLIVTFDIPGFQVDQVAHWLGQPLDIPGNPLTPRTSREPDRVLGVGDEWRVGYLVLSP